MFRIAPAPAKKSRALAIGVGGLVLLAAAGFAAWRLWPRAVPFTSIALSQITNTGTLENVALSGDGKFLAEVKNDAGQRTLWIRNIATNTDTQILTAVPNAYVGLSFSPDANYLYFTRGTPDNIAVRSLFLMPVFGGTPRQLIHDIDSAASLSPDGSRFVYLRWTPGQKDRYSEIHVADKDGANDQVVYTTLNVAEAPAWSPQPNQIAWIEQTGAGRLGHQCLRPCLEDQIFHCSATGRFVRPHSFRFRPGMVARRQASGVSLLQGALRPRSDWHCGLVRR